MAPFEITHDSGICYWLVCPPQSLNDVRVAAFRTWLLEEIGPQTTDAAEA